MEDQFNVSRDRIGIFEHRSAGDDDMDSLILSRNLKDKLVFGVCEQDRKVTEQYRTPNPKSKSWEGVKYELEGLRSQMSTVETTTSTILSDIGYMRAKLSEMEHLMLVRRTNGIQSTVKDVFKLQSFVKDVLRWSGANRRTERDGKKIENTVRLPAYDIASGAFDSKGKTKIYEGEDNVFCQEKKARHERKLETFPWNGRVSKKDTDTLAYLFRNCGNVEEIRREQVGKCGDYVVSLMEFHSLSPNVAISSSIINIWAAYLNEDESVNWFFPASFALTANTEDATLDVNALVALTIRKCRLRQFNRRLNKCSKIFIPIKDQSRRHWFLLVMDLVQQRGELLDSTPDYGFPERRLKLARETINLLQLVFENDMRRSCDVHYNFPSFPLKISATNPTHESSNESGIYVLRHMQHHCTNWYEEFIAEDHRSSMCIEIVMHPRNELLKKVIAAAKCFRNSKVDPHVTNKSNDVLPLGESRGIGRMWHPDFFANVDKEKKTPIPTGRKWRSHRKRKDPA